MGKGNRGPCPLGNLFQLQRFIVGRLGTVRRWVRPGHPALLSAKPWERRRESESASWRRIIPCDVPAIIWVGV